MKIASSTIQMAANSTSKLTHKKTETIQLQNTNNEQTNSPKKTGLKLYDQFGLSKQSIENPTKLSQLDSDFEDFLLDIPESEKDKIRLFKKLFESLTGKKMDFYLPTHFRGKRHKNKSDENPPIPTTQNQGGIGVRYEKHVYHKESATMSFTSSGIVTTEDGKKINFEVNVNLARSFESEQHTVFQTGNMQDPLVINFDRFSAELTDNKIDFDITSTGNPSQISFVKSGSGFLAMDKNHDGVINDGTELFGPKTGNGFLELSAYDSDQNGWIDENDTAFDNLLIWTKDENGDNQLFGLLDKNVGAIYLGNVVSEYGLKTTGNELLGQIQSTGIFLKEDGQAGTIQHVDLAL